MTIAKAGSATATVTIPAREFRYPFYGYTGEITTSVKVPRGAMLRSIIKYAETPANISLAGNTVFLDKTTNNKGFEYIISATVKNGFLVFGYFIQYYATGEETALSTAQTFTFDVDYLEQPNT